MTKVKVLDLAREVGMEDDKLLMKLKRMGVKMKDKKSEEPEKVKPLSDERVIGRDSEKEIVEKRVKPTVIRRRTRNLEQKVEPAPPAEMPSPPPIVAEPKVQEKRDLKEAEGKVQEAEAKEVTAGSKGTKKSKAEGSQEVPLQAEPPTAAKEVTPVRPRREEGCPSTRSFSRG